MKAYVGAKIINAEPCFEAQFASDQGKPEPFQNRAGYKVAYPDGYVSWSPKEVFEEAYRLVNDGESDIIVWRDVPLVREGK